MQAIILAAGCGSRLAPVLKGKPKCLAPVGEVNLIEYQLAALHSFGITDVCVVLGYCGNQVRQAIGDRCHYVVNRRYAKTNSLYSLWLTRNWVCDDFILMNSDILAHPEVYRRLLETPGNALAYDSSSGTEAEHMKVAFRGKKLKRISKSLSVEKAHGESTGLLKFTASTVRSFFNAAEKALVMGGENQWAPAAIEQLAHEMPIRGVDIADLPWVEIDFPEDWHHACERIWPKIRRAVVSSRLKHTVPSPAALRELLLESEVA
ncbi:hypothetical protein NIES2119_03440 [[Phormidium ambiguum] IAM M-71]|uniref:MobA-like NTP transferase domain-containing protein n=1 Tax=[Phormidium ambiguum] IAM M-71 TaxID=454136 RepID=A0A1U7IRJ8_9CYAN|nr:phosphocholine cytidylyltransferase family protein [Phormidium ambiguum]OKH40013.1 hypothetical protein NIES2119_03440 [Phormidium ambiguum IAM M-71]